MLVKICLHMCVYICAACLYVYRLECVHVLCAYMCTHMHTLYACAGRANIDISSNKMRTLLSEDTEDDTKSPSWLAPGVSVFKLKGLRVPSHDCLLLRADIQCLHRHGFYSNREGRRSWLHKQCSVGATVFRNHRMLFCAYSCPSMCMGKMLYTHVLINAKADI